MAEVTRIALTFQKITDLNDNVTFTQELTGCMFDQSLDPSPCVEFEGTRVNTFTDGAFQGSEFIPTAPSEGFDINNFLDIQWCPNQNYFQVKVAGEGPYTLRSQGRSGSGCDESWSVLPAPRLTSPP